MMLPFPWVMTSQFCVGGGRDDDGTVLRCALDGLHHLGLGDAVKRAGHLIEDQHRRVVVSAGRPMRCCPPLRRMPRSPMIVLPSHLLSVVMNSSERSLPP